MKRSRSLVATLALLFATAIELKGAENQTAESTAVVPQPGTPREIRPPVPEITRLRDGVSLWHIEANQVPLVSLAIYIPSGAQDDPSGKAGLAALTASMADEGAGERDAIQLADELDVLGARLSAVASREGTTLSLRVLRKNLEPALAVLSDVLLRPRFEDDDWNRLRTIWVNSLKQRKNNPGQVARVIGPMVFFGAGHPYARPVSGFVSSIESIELADVKAFHKDHWHSGGAKVVSAGSISAAELASLLNRALEGWKRRESSAPELPPALPTHKRPRVVVANAPGSTQTVIRIIGPGIARGSADYLPLSLVNIIFGASFTSRLNQNLRERNGFTYGAGSAFSRLRGPGMFLSASSVRGDVTGKSILAFREEYLKLSSSSISPGELTKARSTLKHSIVESLETLAGNVGAFLEIAGVGLAEDTLARMPDEIDKLGAAEIEARARRIVNWEATTIILVGDLEVIEKQLGELDDEALKTFTLVDEEGNPVKR